MYEYQVSVLLTVELHAHDLLTVREIHHLIPITLLFFFSSSWLVG
jgi:hypothetical protein